MSKKKFIIVDFGNDKGFKIISKRWIKSIKEKIKEIGTYNLNTKYYSFLNRKNLSNLKKKKLVLSSKSFGKNINLFLTKFNNKNYSIFINNKTNSMILSRFRFTNDIFNGTLFCGEFIKNNNDKWVYLINDICYYKGENIITQTFNDRYETMKKIFSKNFKNDDNLSVCKIQIKKYFDKEYMISIYKKKQEIFDYKISGFYFKNIYNFSDNYLYTFIENRSNFKIKNNNSDNSLISLGTEEIKIDYNKKEHFKDCEEIDNKKLNNETNKLEIKNNGKKGKNDIQREYCIMYLKPTSLPDIYELYHYNNKKVELNSVASIPNNNISKYIRKVLKKKTKSVLDGEISSESELSDVEEEIDYNIKFKCYYHKRFNKWVPYEFDNSSNHIDNINNINKILYNVKNS